MSQPAVQQIVEAAERRTLTIEMIEAGARNTQRVGRKELASALKTASRSMPTLVDQACRTSAVTKDASRLREPGYRMTG
ncbi:hypothetical protein HYS28_01840 [Candidatus Uhrbacteria bacterium]|nr:hypothetical protein [Candidatus Uhrbacteria bacterium]